LESLASSQSKLSKKNLIRVVIVGAGGLGTSAAWGLAASWGQSREQSRRQHGRQDAPPLEIHLIDPENIELSNLNRQVLFTEEHLGVSKAKTLAAKIKDQLVGEEETAVRIVAIEHRLSKANIHQLLHGASYVIDGTDSTETKFLINDFCVRWGIPFCYGGALGTQGQLLAVRPGTGACLRCLFGNFTEDDYQTFHTSCQQAGIVGPVVGYLGFLQANAALTHLSANQEYSASVLARFSLLDLNTNTTLVPPAPDCPLRCGEQPSQTLDIRDKQCPMTFLYTKLALEKLPLEATLRVQLGTEESAQNVSETCRQEGYQVVTDEASKERWALLIRKHQEN